jgi:membrane protein
MPGIQDRILAWKPVAFLVRVSKKIILPGFDRMPLYDVVVFFVKGLYEGNITSRASAVSFNFFMAIFPSLLFFFTIIPFIPIANFQQSLLDLMKDLLPHSAYETVRETVVDIVTRPRSGLLSVGFILALYFSTNGVDSMMDAFNSTYHELETRSVIRQRLVSLFLVLIFSFLLIVAIGLITFGTRLLALLFPATLEGSGIYFGVLWFLKWVVIVATIFLAISFLYYMAPARKRHFRFISAGSTLATILIIATTLAFNYYADKFSRYNILYGSIGTLLIVLLWIYFNSFSLLIGFELNASIHIAKVEKGDSPGITGQAGPGSSGSAPSGK